MSRVLVTGANSGLGFEACRQLASRGGFSRIILACRSKEKADQAATELSQTTNTDPSLFQVLQLDVSNLDSCRAAAKQLDAPIDLCLLNAGGFADQKLTKEGLLEIFQMNTMGHAVFLESIIKQQKLAKGGRVVFAGSEGSRGVGPIQKTKYPSPDVAGITAFMTGTAYQNYDVMQAYGNTKTIGANYISCMARKFPDYYFATVSPGGTSGTSVNKNAPGYISFIGSLCSCCLSAGGMTHSPAEGAARYITVLCEPQKYPSGTVIMSARGATGPLADQATIGHADLFADQRLQDAAYEAMRKYIN
eukprot:TRINITY_DN4761_c0_g1_i3.p1 TRINITY_DN4761_c0_g1~~TRINITY_DN4761_c0_g1_i3.p1  ORF type:complete len:305 (+),score=46.38 TRINITY_DN4761_c0_g1_i3:53-967(+)